MLCKLTLRRATVGVTAVVVAATATGVATLARPSGAAPAVAAVTAKAITCSTSSSGKSASFYSGPSVSYAYDRRFSATKAIVPNLDTHTPQGVAMWHNWDGKGHDLLLVTAYRDGARAYVHGIDRATGAHINTAEIAATHAGGIAISGNWIFISGAGQSIRKYRTSDMRLAMNHRRGHLYISSVGTPRAVHGASFLSTYGGYLYAGLFNPTGRDRMYAYKIASNGSLTTQPGGYQIPTKTQGVAVTGTRFIFSTSYGRRNRGNIYVVKRGYSSLDSAKLYCFRSPSMNEGVTSYGSTLYVTFESGSYEYRSTALNPITRLHKAAMSSLTNLV